MPSRSHPKRRKEKSIKKMNTTDALPIYHSQHPSHLQGTYPFVVGFSASHNKMEDASNWTMGETNRTEPLDEIKEVIVRDVEDIKSETDYVRHIAIDGISESMSETQKGNDLSFNNSSANREEEPDEKKSLKVVDLEKSDENKEVPVPVTLSKDLAGILEVAIENSDISDVFEFRSKEKDEKVLPSLNQTNEFSSVETNELSNGIDLEESALPISCVNDQVLENDGSSVVITNMESERLEEVTLPSLDANRRDPSDSADVLMKAIEESTLVYTHDNQENYQDVGEVDLKRTEETKMQDSDENASGHSSPVDKESNGNVGQSVEASSVNVIPVAVVGTNSSDDKAEIPETAGSPPVISMRRRTSWLGCCGLVQVLRRSDR